MTGEVMTASL